jgi:HEAT repeat protein
VNWTDLGDYQERFEAHIDALVIGKDLALEVCKERCASGDFGELHAAISVFCRQDRSDLVYAVLQGLDHQNAQVVQAVIDALKAECPATWHEDLTRVMLGRGTDLVPLLAEVLAYRRAPIEDAVLRVLPSCAEQHLPRTFLALGRAGTEKSRTALPDSLRSENAAVAEAACRALIRLGDYQALRYGLLVAQLRPWPVVALGIGGDHTAVNVLIDIAKSDKVSDDVLIALGLLGDLRSVSTIFDCLANPERAMAAAIALQTITGAALFGQVFIPDKVDPDELFEEERKKYDETGEVPRRSDGKPFGSNVTQLSTDPDAWKAWLTEHRSQFLSTWRYRHGKPFSPDASLKALRDERTPNRVRALICDEFVVRYRANVTLEIDMPVREQHRHLDALAQWVQANSKRFIPGAWYFAGRAMAEPPPAGAAR